MDVGTRDPVGRRQRAAGATASARPVAPGLAVVAVACAVAFAATRVIPSLNASTVAVVLGALLANLGLHRSALRPGTRFAAHRLLRAAVVLLGLQLSLHQVGALGARGLAVVLVTVSLTFVGTQLLGRALGVPPARSLLVATGFSICGASAVAAMEEVAGGDEADTGVAIALVTLCGSLAILVLPALRVPLGLDVPAFGAWVGASVHDVGQTVATASRVPGALSAAVVVKLSRVVLLAPLVAGVAVVRRRRGELAVADGVRRPPVVPPFVLGFLGCIALASTGRVPSAVLGVAATLQQVLLVAALVGLGTGIHVATLRRTAGRAAVLGGLSWLLVAAVAYAGVRLVGPSLG
jgi:uncharacterized integral membrane protein (TIGR00698 family)